MSTQVTVHREQRFTNCFNVHDAGNEMGLLIKNIESVYGQQISLDEQVSSPASPVIRLVGAFSPHSCPPPVAPAVEEIRSREGRCGGQAPAYNCGAAAATPASDGASR